MAPKKSTTVAAAAPVPEPVEEVIEEVIESGNESEDDNENNLQGLMNSRIKANPILGKFLKEINEKMQSMFDGIPDMIPIFWGESKESLVNYIKKANKRTVKKDAKFVPTGLKKPSNALNIFTKKFQEQCKASGGKYSHTAKNEAWAKLTAAEKAVYQKQYEEEKVKYEAAFAKQREEAIKNGLFPEDKPKSPNTSYFLFLADIRPQLTKKYEISAADAAKLSQEELSEKKTENNRKIITEAGKMWKELSEEQKSKYVNLYKKEKEEYDAKMAEWTKRDLERRKKNGEAVEESSQPEIETNAVKSAESATVAAAAAAAAVAAVAAVGESKNKTTKAKPKAK